MIIPLDGMPDCDSCRDPSKRIMARTMDLEGPGQKGILWTCDNKDCRRKKNAAGSYILRRELNLHESNR